MSDVGFADFGPWSTVNRHSRLTIHVPQRFMVHSIPNSQLLIPFLPINQSTIQLINLPHSVLKLLTGLAIAARIAWKLIVNSAINNATTVVITKTAQLMFTR